MRGPGAIASETIGECSRRRLRRRIVESSNRRRIVVASSHRRIVVDFVTVGAIVAKIIVVVVIFMVIFPRSMPLRCGAGPPRLAQMVRCASSMRRRAPRHPSSAQRAPPSPARHAACGSRRLPRGGGGVSIRGVGGGGERVPPPGRSCAPSFRVLGGPSRRRRPSRPPSLPTHTSMEPTVQPTRPPPKPHRPHHAAEQIADRAAELLHKGLGQACSPANRPPASQEME